MRNPKDFFRPLAVGAPEPVREIPFRPSRMIHFFPASNPKMVAKVPEIAAKVDILVSYSADELRQLMGISSRQIPHLLGYTYGEEAIHRDNLVLLAGG